MEYEYKEVEFWKYCEKCKHYEVEDVKDPCNDCQMSQLICIQQSQCILRRSKYGM